MTRSASTTSSSARSSPTDVRSRSVARLAAGVLKAWCVVVGACLSGTTCAADWQTSSWELVESSRGFQKRSAPIRSIVRTENGRLLGTRPAGATIELWGSDTNGVDWFRLPNIAQSGSVVFGDSTLCVLPSGEILAGYREHSSTLGWSVRVSRSLDGGGSWSFAGTIHDWTLSQSEFVGAPFFSQLSDGTLQVYYDSEPAAPGSSQYIALKTGSFNSGAGQWQWSNPRVVNSTPANTTFVRDGMPTVVNLGPDLDGIGDRLMVVTEGVSVTGGVAHNVIRAFQVQNGGVAQSDWDNLLDSRVIYRSPLLDPQGHRYNAYAPYAIRVGDGPVIVGFSTDEFLKTLNQSADSASSPPHLRHSEIKLIQTTFDFEHWSEPETVWGLDHPDFMGSGNAGDIFNYQFGMFELSPNDVLATLDMFQGRQLVFRPSLGGLSADFDEDGDVDGRDFLVWQRGFGLTGQTSTTTGDATGEGTVNAADLAQWRQQYGSPTASLQQPLHVIPEPRAEVIALVVAVLLLSRRFVP